MGEDQVAALRDVDFFVEANIPLLQAAVEQQVSAERRFQARRAVPLSVCSLMPAAPASPPTCHAVRRLRAGSTTLRQAAGCSSSISAFQRGAA
jgi:hypothetical protein